MSAITQSVHAVRPDQNFRNVERVATPAQAAKAQKSKPDAPVTLGGNSLGLPALNLSSPFNSLVPGSQPGDAGPFTANEADAVSEGGFNFKAAAVFIGLSIVALFLWKKFT